MTLVCNKDFSLKSTESEGGKRHKLGSMRLSLLIQKFYFTHIENIVTKISPIMHFYLMTLMLLLPHSVVHALFDSKWSLLKPVQKMLCTFTLLSRHILEPSYHDSLMFKPSCVERRHSNHHQLGNSCPTSEGVAFLNWASNHPSKAPEQKQVFLLSEISMKPEIL